MTKMIEKFNDASAVMRLMSYTAITLVGIGVAWGVNNFSVKINTDKNIEQDGAIDSIRSDLSDIKTKSAVQATDTDYIKRDIRGLKTQSKEQTKLLQQILMNQKQD